MIEKTELYSLFNTYIDKTIESYLIANPDIAKTTIEYFKLMMFQYCIEMDKEVNIGASKPKEFDDSDIKEFKRVSDIALERAIKNYRDPVYHIPIHWSNDTIKIFKELNTILFDNLKNCVNIRLKGVRRKKRRKII